MRLGGVFLAARRGISELRHKKFTSKHEAHQCIHHPKGNYEEVMIMLPILSLKADNP